MDIPQLPQVEGEASVKRKFKSYPIGYFHMDIAELRTEQGKLYLVVAIDRTSKSAFVEVHQKVARRTPLTSSGGANSSTLPIGRIDASSRWRGCAAFWLVFASERAPSAFNRPVDWSVPKS